MEHPSVTTEYILTAAGPAGQLVRQVRKVEVQQRVEIVGFTAAKPVVFLDDTIVLRWETKAATRVSLRLRTAALGARFEFPETSEPATGEVGIPVKSDQFTRYGPYIFELDAEGLQGLISRSVTVYLRQQR